MTTYRIDATMWTSSCMLELCGIPDLPGAVLGRWMHVLFGQSLIFCFLAEVMVREIKMLMLLLQYCGQQHLGLKLLID